MLQRRFVNNLSLSVVLHAGCVFALALASELHTHTHTRTSCMHALLHRRCSQKHFLESASWRLAAFGPQGASSPFHHTTYKSKPQPATPGHSKQQPGANEQARQHARSTLASSRCRAGRRCLCLPTCLPSCLPHSFQHACLKIYIFICLLLFASGVQIIKRANPDNQGPRSCPLPTLKNIRMYSPKSKVVAVSRIVSLGLY